MKLAELILQRRAVLGGRKPLTYRELSARARARGYTLADVTISDFVNHPLAEPPRRKTMEALAVALDVPYRTVVVAVAASMIGDTDDVNLEQAAEEEHVRAWVTLTEGRTDDERARMIEVVRSVAAALSASQAEESNTDPAADSLAHRNASVTKRDNVASSRVARNP